MTRSDLHAHERKTTFVLLPGLEGSDVLFEPLLAALPASIDARAIRYPTDRPSAYKRLLEVARAAINQCDECVLLGWCFSSPIAITLAAEMYASVFAHRTCRSSISQRVTIGWCRRAAVVRFKRFARMRS
ncbi:MAG: hypothetical protein SGJ11_02295 [Phycisphaerae bacterium]|nr:hypothetical protein [Phycisphaerae bacterium]